MVPGLQIRLPVQGSDPCPGKISHAAGQLSPHSLTRDAAAMRRLSTAAREEPCPRQLEKACAQPRRPRAAKNKSIKKVKMSPDMAKCPLKAKSPPRPSTDTADLHRAVLGLPASSRSEGPITGDPTKQGVGCASSPSLDAGGPAPSSSWQPEEWGA